LVRDHAGNLYGTTVDGRGGLSVCSGGCGVVYKLGRTGKETVLYSFTGGADGGSSYAGLVRDKAGNLYGTTTGGGIYGQGTVFKLDATDKETVLYCFTGGMDGGTPGARLLRDNAGNLYGTTQYGGDLSCSVSFPPGCGVVFKLDPAGKETVLHSFTGPDGSLSFTGLVRDAAGNLYGTTAFGGASGNGVVFKVDPAGKETVLHSFTGGADGANPYASVVRDAAGNLYGTTYAGGNTGGFCSKYGGCGVVFKLDTTGEETVLHTFTGRDGLQPRGALLRDAAGDLYGTTSIGGDLNGCSGIGCGVVFKLTP
jgi:uncharacterized repeat protein (TIGR03803 family)